MAFLFDFKVKVCVLIIGSDYMLVEQGVSLN